MTKESEIQFEAPDWMNDKYTTGKWRHVAGLDEKGNDYYKAVLVNEEGDERWWVWENGERRQYGPQFNTEDRRRLTAAVEAKKPEMF